MKRIGVAGLISTAGGQRSRILLGRRGKEPNKGLYVLPGGGVKDGESLEDALLREIFEETGLKARRAPDRWDRPAYGIDLPDRLILVGLVVIDGPSEPKGGDDLYDVEWFPADALPQEISPVVLPALNYWGFYPKDFGVGRE